MRYDNWDVIVFPKESAIPIQEFRTACYTTQDERESSLLFSACCSNLVDLISHFLTRWPLPTDIDLLHRISASSNSVSYLRTLMDLAGEAI
jgi:hypothetical protein